MITVEKWVPAALAGLQEAFGARLQYFGLQGSYRRGEATETSDIDLVTLLDTVSLDDLESYRGIVHALPEGEKACGFICGVEEFARWPRHELYPFKMDTADYHGALDDYLPPISRDDIRDGARIGASGLIHGLTHSYLYAAEADKPAILKECYKSAFFVMQVASYLTTNVYHTSKSALLRSLTGQEKEIIEAGMDFQSWLSRHSVREAYSLLLGWCRNVLVAADDF